MKKLVIIFFILVTSNHYSNASIIETIESERKQCLNTNYLNDYLMSQCNYKAIEKYDKEIDGIIRKLVKNIDRKQCSLLVQSQNKWDKFIQDDNFLLKNLYEKDNSLEKELIISSIQCQNKKYRLEELLILYHSINNK
ncbi:MAG: DUF1311 domain-containing protein [Cyanobacteria bacterium SIG29]|nr:DUF1311 domain-containing protein [Cyanobacteria bacterium SIG29]